MGVLDKLKSAAQAMTGGAAKVSIEYPLQAVFPGEGMNVRVTVVSAAGGEVKSQGVFVDLLAEERITGSENVRCPRCGNGFSAPVREAKKTVEQSFPVAPAFVLAPGESRVFEASLQIPGGAPPTYAGPQTHHEWKIRGRVQATGNDPDSGFQPLRVGLKQ
jgi:sporulation-control protein spo0M